MMERGKDIIPLLLGKYPLGMHMEKPLDEFNDEKPWLKVSHMPIYQLKEKNKPWLKQLDEFKEECKDKLDYL
jgi:hypothetical protein